MPYDREIFDEVSRSFAQHRLQEKRDFKKRRQSAYEKIPRIKEIDDELSSTGIDVARSVLSVGRDA